jgi:hypothetical protein
MLSVSVHLCVRVCVSVSVNPPMKFWIPESISTKFGIYHSTWGHLNGALHKSLPTVCVSAYAFLLSLLGNDWVICILPFVDRQRLCKHLPEAKNTRNRIVVHVCLWVGLRIALSLLGNNSVKNFPRQQRIVGGVVFYAACVLKESRRLVLPELLVLAYFLYFEKNEIRLTWPLCFIIKRHWKSLLKFAGESFLWYLHNSLSIFLSYFPSCLDFSLKTLNSLICTHFGWRSFRCGAFTTISS